MAFTRLQDQMEVLHDDSIQFSGAKFCCSVVTSGYLGKSTQNTGLQILELLWHELKETDSDARFEKIENIFISFSLSDRDIFISECTFPERFLFLLFFQEMPYLYLVKNSNQAIFCTKIIICDFFFSFVFCGHIMTMTHLWFFFDVLY